MNVRAKLSIAAALVTLAGIAGAQQQPAAKTAAKPVAARTTAPAAVAAPADTGKAMRKGRKAHKKGMRKGAAMKGDSMKAGAMKKDTTHRKP
jgi:hypothetical protein